MSQSRFLTMALFLTIQFVAGAINVLTLRMDTLLFHNFFIPYVLILFFSAYSFLHIFLPCPPFLRLLPLLFSPNFVYYIFVILHFLHPVLSLIFYFHSSSELVFQRSSKFFAILDLASKQANLVNEVRTLPSLSV